MSSQAMKWFENKVRIAHPGLTHLTLVLAMKADKNGASWLSQATIAEMMGGSVHTVRKWLSALHQLGVIQRSYRSNGRGGRSSDLVRLRLDQQFDVQKVAIRDVFQAAHGATSKPGSKWHRMSFQVAPGARDKGSDQQRLEVYQEKHPQDSQSAQRAHGGEKPTLAVVNGGRAA